jgi:O-antigen/teichoic acid export membrane protein
LGHIATFTKSGIQKKGLHAVVDQGIISGLNFITFLLLARWMETADFGQYILAFSVLLFIQTLSHALFTRAHNVLGAKAEGAEYASLTQTVIKLVLGFGAAVTLGSLVLMFAFRSVSLAAWSDGALALAISSAPWILQDAVRRVLYTSGRILGAALNDAICYSIQVVAILVFMQTDLAASQLVVFGILGGSSLVAAVFGLVQIRPFLAGFWRHQDGIHATARRLWNFGKWLSTGEFIGWIGQNGNTWIIGGLMGAPLVAGYRASTYVTNLLNPIDLSVSNYLPVRAAQIERDQGRGAMIRWLRLKAVVMCIPYAILVIGISLGALQLLNIFFDERYATDLFAIVLSVSAIARFFGFATNFARIGLMATENNRPILFSQIISLVLFVTVSYGMISWLGVTGAPLAKIFLHIGLGLYLSHALVKPPVERVARVETASA